LRLSCIEPGIFLYYECAEAAGVAFVLRCRSQTLCVSAVEELCSPRGCRLSTQWYLTGNQGVH